MNYLRLKIIKLVENEYLIKNDFEIFKIFYRFFLFRPVFKSKILFFLFEHFIYVIALVFFKLKINSLFSNGLDEDFLIKRIGTGNYPNIITLKKNDQGNAIVKKEFHNEDIFKKELKYLSEYCKNSAGINFPSFVIHKNYLEYHFINHSCLALEIKQRKYSKTQITDIFEKISFSVDRLYNFKNKCLIHGDLTPDNIYIINNKIYFIDYSDSEIYFKDFDKFTLLNKMLKDYGKNKKEIIGYLKKYNLNKLEFWKHLENKKIIKHYKL